MIIPPLRIYQILLYHKFPLLANYVYSIIVQLQLICIKKDIAKYYILYMFYLLSLLKNLRILPTTVIISVEFRCAIPFPKALPAIVKEATTALIIN